MVKLKIASSGVLNYQFYFWFKKITERVSSWEHDYAWKKIKEHCIETLSGPMKPKTKWTKKDGLITEIKLGMCYEWCGVFENTSLCFFLIYNTYYICEQDTTHNQKSVKNEWKTK